VRNSQATVLAPHRTIGLMMDCDTTGIEPDLSAHQGEEARRGGTMMIVNQTIPRALANLAIRATRPPRSSPTSTSTRRSSVRRHVKPPPAGVRVLDGRQPIEYLGT